MFRLFHKHQWVKKTGNAKIKIGNRTSSVVLELKTCPVCGEEKASVHELSGEEWGVHPDFVRDRVK